MVKCNDTQNKMCVKDVSMNSPRHMIYDYCIISLEYYQVGISLSVKDVSKKINRHKFCPTFFYIKYVTEIPAKLHKYSKVYLFLFNALSLSKLEITFFLCNLTDL